MRTPSLGIRGGGRLVSGGIQRLLEAGQVAGLVMGVGNRTMGVVCQRLSLGK